MLGIFKTAINWCDYYDPLSKISKKLDYHDFCQSVIHSYIYVYMRLIEYNNN